MKKILYIVLILVSGYLMAQDVHKEKIYHQFTTINNFTEFDTYGTFETDTGIKLKVDKEWIDYFIKYHDGSKEERIEFVFYNNKNEFRYFGVVYDDPITYVGLPDEEGNVEVFIIPCPTPFKLYKNNPDFDRLYNLLKELKESQEMAWVGVVWGGYFEIFDIKKL